MVKKSADKKLIIVLFTTLSVVIIDRLTKLLAESFASQPKNLIDGISITYVKNTGAAFGLFANQSAFLILASLAAIAAILYYYNKLPKNKAVYISTGLLLGGITGNLIDRIFISAVIDFIDFGFWPAFNIADLSASTGIALLIALLVLKKGR